MHSQHKKCNMFPHFRRRTLGQFSIINYLIKFYFQNQDLLYDRSENRGYIISCIHRTRQKLYSIEEGTSSSSRKRKSNTQTTATGPPKQVRNFSLDENLLILKNANVTTQKKLIEEKLRDTLCIRKELLESPLELLNFSSWFPFFFTCPSLVRFKLMSNFQRIFFDYILIPDFTRLLAKISKSE